MQRMQRMNKQRGILAIGAAATAALLAICPASVNAGTAYYWDVNGAIAGFGSGNGTWATSGGTNWTTDVTGSSATANWVNNGANSDAYFQNGAGAGTITLGGNMTAGNVDFSPTSGNYILQISGTRTLTLSSFSGADLANTIIRNDTSARTLTIATNVAGDTPTFSGSLQNNGATALALIYSGLGTLTLSGANSYSGLTTVSTTSGTIVFAGTNSSAGNTTISSTGTMKLANASNGGLASGLLTISGATAKIEADGASRSLSNDITYTSAGATFQGANGITLNGALTQSAGNRTLYSSISGSALTLAGNVYLSDVVGTGRTLTLRGTGDTNVTGVIANYNGAGVAGNLTINTASGVTTLSNANTYTGTTNLTAGTLRITGSLGNSAVTVGAGTLELNAASAVGQNTVTVNNAASVLTQNTANALGGTAALTQSNGSVVLSQSNNYSGDTTFSGGALSIGASGSLGSGTLKLNGGTFSATAAVAPANAVSIGGTATIAGSSAIDFGGNLIIAGNASRTLTINNTALTTFSGGTYTLNDAIGAGGTKTHTLAGTGDITIGGNIVNGSDSA